METRNEKQAKTLQVVVMNDKRFAIEERNGNISFNLTQMAKPFGKAPKDWRKTDESKRYLEAMSKGRKIPLADLVEVRKGGTPEIAGTWANDARIAVRFAQWLDMDFAIAVDELIYKVLTKQALVAEPFMGEYPVIIGHRAVYNYINVLKKLNYSTTSGSVWGRKNRYPNHFVKLYDRNFITLDFCVYLKNLQEVRQLELQFKESSTLIA